MTAPDFRKMADDESEDARNVCLEAQEAEYRGGLGDYSVVRLSAFITLMKECFRAGQEEMRDRAANEVPDNWVDPLLTGPTSISLKNCSCPEIEALLRKLKDNIATLKLEVDAE